MPSENHALTSPVPGLNLSPALAAALLYGSVGTAHRLRLATLAMEALAQGQQGASRPLAMDFLLSAFESDPADSAMAKQVLHFGMQLKALTPEQQVLLRAAAHGDDKENGESRGTGGSRPLHQWRDGLAAWRDGHMIEALKHFRLSGSVFTTPLEYMGHCLAALGQRDEALNLWRHVLQRRPWHTQLYLTVHDYMEGHDQPLANLSGKTAVLFYSWNKAHDLNAALASLADADGTLPASLPLVVCLDNGSTDATHDVLRRWQERWGQRFMSVRLPVNIGAAAARNWLASLPEVRALPYAVYIDDDALLPSPPADWLGHLGRAVHTYPHAAVWGCRIVDAHAPHNLQCGPLHMQPLFCLGADAGGPLPGQPEPDTTPHPDVAFSPLLAEGQPFRLTEYACFGSNERQNDALNSGPDNAAYTFLRPCASVTGCCHLFRTAELTAQGFSLNFSPSQYDDAQRDLLMLQQGRMACYTGFCTVQHSKRTGAGTGAEAGAGAKKAHTLSSAAYGNALGNRFKLHGLFDADSAAACVRHEYAELERDFRQRVARVNAGWGT